MLYELVVVQHPARLGIERDHGVGIEIVAFAQLGVEIGRRVSCLVATAFKSVGVDRGASRLRTRSCVFFGVNVVVMSYSHAEMNCRSAPGAGLPFGGGSNGKHQVLRNATRSRLT